MGEAILARNASGGDGGADWIFNEGGTYRTNVANPTFSADRDIYFGSSQNTITMSSNNTSGGRLCSGDWRCYKNIAFFVLTIDGLNRSGHFCLNSPTVLTIDSRTVTVELYCTNSGQLYYRTTDSSGTNYSLVQSTFRYFIIAEK